MSASALQPVRSARQGRISSSWHMHTAADSSGPAPRSTPKRSEALDTNTNRLDDFEHPVSIEEFRRMGYEAVDMICSYMAYVLPNARVVPNIQPGYLRPLLPDAAPVHPEPWENIKRDFCGKIVKGVTHWQSPNYFAWFPANTSMPGILAQMLSAALNMVGFNWESGPVGTELEMVVLDWLVKLCGLPDKFLWHKARTDSCSCSDRLALNNISSSSVGTESLCDSPCSTSSGGSSGSGGVSTGVSSSASCDGSSITSTSSSNSSRKSPGGVLQGSSSEAVLVAMLAARARALAGQAPEAAVKLVAYGTEQAHSCFIKATMVAGIQHVRLLPASRATDFAVQPQQLETAVSEDLAQGLIPFYFMATIGTTSSCAVDPISGLADVCLRYKIWMHVDAAWAGTAAILPEQRHWFDGLDQVDSYSFNPYKWMLTPMGVCACWFDDSSYLKEALSLTPTYLRSRGNMPEFKNWEIPLGRRFRALDLWFVLRMYGTDKIREMVRHHIALGKWLAEQVEADDRFELAAPPRFGLVCLRLRDVGNEGNRALLAAVNSAGLSHMVGTDLDGLFTIRVAIGQANTQLKHVQQVWNLLQQQASLLLAQHDT